MEKKFYRKGTTIIFAVLIFLLAVLYGCNSSEKTAYSVQMSNWPESWQSYGKPSLVNNCNLLSYGYSDKLHIWNTNNGEQTSLNVTDKDKGLFLIGNKESIAIGYSNRIEVHKLNDSSNIKVYNLPVPGKKNYQLFEEEGKLWAVYYPAFSYDNPEEIEVWNIIEQKQLIRFNLNSPKAVIQKVVLNIKAGLLVLGYGKPWLDNDLPSYVEYYAEVFSLKDGSSIYKLASHTQGVMTLSISSDGKYVATGGSWGDGKLKLWDMITGKLLYEFKTKREPKLISLFADWEQVRAIAFSKDNKLIAFGGGDYKIYVMNVENGQIVKTFEGANLVLNVSFKESGKELCSISMDGFFSLWKIVD